MLKQIHCLSFGGDKGIGDEGLEFLLQVIQQIRALEVSGCNITAAGTKALAIKLTETQYKVSFV